MSSDNETTLSSSSDSTAEHLEHLSARIIDCIRNRDWSNQDWIDYVGENVQVYAPASFLELHGEPATVGRDAYMESYKAFTVGRPSKYCLSPLLILLSRTFRKAKMLVHTSMSAGSIFTDMKASY